MSSWDCDPPYAFYPNGERPKEEPKPEKPKPADENTPILLALSSVTPAGGSLRSVVLTGKAADGRQVWINMTVQESELRKLL